MKRTYLPIILVALLLMSRPLYAGEYNGFRVAIYARAYEVKEMGNLKRLDSLWTAISQQVRVDKIYIETHRDNLLVGEQTIDTAKAFFAAKGLQVAGGITYTMNERNRYETFCFSNPEHRKKAKEIAELTARHFDEFILDDFFFTNCKCELCIKAKGNMSWTEYRLRIMTHAADELILKPARAVNPKVRIVIKFPNWYEHFPGLGFDLETEPKLFDGIYTGTETRDPVRTAQHLQQYESYLIFRYFENIKPGGNGGGWVDPGAMYYLDRYAEQLWLTLFAKAPEITLFDFRQLTRPIAISDRARWQSGESGKPSFDFDGMMKPIQLAGGKIVAPTTIARAAGVTFEAVSSFIQKLGTPLGVKSYKPYLSTGEDFLQNFLGMIGVPMDIVPNFPTDAKMIFLTESAKYDPGIVNKIKSQLASAKNVMITSGLLHALQGKGIEDIAELECLERKALVKDFNIGRDGYSADKEILIPQIHYFTNDSWEDISGLDSAIGWPILHQAAYAKGSLFVLTIPDNFADLYNLPEAVLNRIRHVLSQDINVRLEGKSQISLFAYDNSTFIIESFLLEKTTVKVIARSNANSMRDILSGEILTGQSGRDSHIFGRESGEVSTFEVALKPHSYRVFKFN